MLTEIMEREFPVLRLLHVVDAGNEPQSASQIGHCSSTSEGSTDIADHTSETDDWEASYFTC